jgi:hypothetical protein
MVDVPPKIPRVFKTAWFAKVAKKALIKDTELCAAFAEMQKGQCEDLGGGVYKKRLDKNRHRSIVLAKGGLHWIYQYLFAKKDRDNIDEKELEGFRKLAKNYEALTPAQLSKLLEAKDLTEICNVDEAKVQK